MFLLLIFPILHLRIISLEPINVQQVSCQNILDGSKCIVDGFSLQNTTGQLKVPSKNVQLCLKNFSNLQTNGFLDSITANNLLITNSSFTAIQKNNSQENKVINFSIKNSTVSLLANGLKSFKNVKILCFQNVIFDKIDLAAFNGMTNIMQLSFSNITMTSQLTTAIRTISNINLFLCTHCNIDDETFDKILDGFNSVETITVMNNMIKRIRCERIVQNNLSELDISQNQLEGTLPTCGIIDINLSINKIEELYIQTGTIAIDASNNLISKIKCDTALETVVLNFNYNLLTNLMCITVIPSIEQLYIDSNNFTYFGLNSFEKMTKLRIISALNNPLLIYPPNLFTSTSKNIIMKITVDRFDDGYEKLRKNYPKLQEIFHDNFNGNCEAHAMATDVLKSQGIRLYLLRPSNCTINLKKV